MTQEFIPYEQALELKHLGFDEECIAYYNIDPYLKKPSFRVAIPFDHPWCLSAPLYQQAFRWVYQQLEIDGVMPLDEQSQIILLKELIAKLSSKRSLV